MAKKNNNVSLNDLNPSTQYYVKIRAVDGNGKKGKWSKVYGMITNSVSSSAGVSWMTPVPVTINGTNVLFGPTNVVYDDGAEGAFNSIFEIELFPLDSLVADVGYYPSGIDNVAVSTELMGVAVSHYAVVFTVSGLGEEPYPSWGRIRTVDSSGAVGDWNWPPTS